MERKHSSLHKELFRMGREVETPRSSSLPCYCRGRVYMNDRIQMKNCSNCGFLFPCNAMFDPEKPYNSKYCSWDCMICNIALKRKTKDKISN
jgi:hypothetical protein